jgi:hypothetical protein
MELHVCLHDWVLDALNEAACMMWMCKGRCVPRAEGLWCLEYKVCATPLWITYPYRLTSQYLLIIRIIQIFQLRRPLSGVRWWLMSQKKSME